MTQIQIKHITKAWGERELFRDLSFSAEYGEHIALVGANGAGKSTLLHILEGSLEADGGSILIPVKSSAACLRQNPLSDRELERLERDGVPAEAMKYLSLFGMQADTFGPLRNFSGGERTKLGLSILLAREPKLLLLDEPTNHLDFDGVRLLIRVLKVYPGTVLTVSHDRYFLDAVAERVLEIEDGRIHEYEGNYSDYRQEKARLFEEKTHRYESAQKEQKRITAEIGRMKQWSEKAHRDSTKADSSGNKMGTKEYKRDKAKKMDQKVKNDRKRLEKKMTASEPRPVAEKQVRFSLAGEAGHGKRVIEAEGISKSFGGRVLFEDSTFTVLRGEHAAVWGPNGCGKSTLISILTGGDSPDSGRIRMNGSLNPFVLEQTFAGFTDDRSVLSWLADTVNGISGADRARLMHMGLTTELLMQPLKTLSFGEQIKVKLAAPILKGQEFLILDEPLNHLDLPMREMLEATLSGYEGTLLLVSHDVYFLEKVCDRVLLFENGRIRRLEESFAEYMEGLV